MVEEVEAALFTIRLILGTVDGVELGAVIAQHSLKLPAECQVDVLIQAESLEKFLEKSLLIVF
jgi:hypothetical protein